MLDNWRTMTSIYGLRRTARTGSIDLRIRRLGFESLRARQPSRRPLPSLPGSYAGHPLPGAGGHRQSPMVVNFAGHMVGISLDDLRRSSSLVIALLRVDDCLCTGEPHGGGQTTMNDPFARLPVVPSFTVTGTDVTDG
jgi:hypothetical protein